VKGELPIRTDAHQTKKGTSRRHLGRRLILGKDERGTKKRNIQRKEEREIREPTEKHKGERRKTGGGIAWRAAGWDYWGTILGEKERWF